MKTNNQLTLTAFVFFFSLLTFAQHEISQREVIALLELQDRTKGHLWTHKWDRDTPISEWYGVTIEDGKLIGLDLSNNNLHGKIPLTIGNLKHLEYLNLSNNKISGKMPKLFRKLKALKTMNLAGNQLKGSMPKTIYQLQSLQELSLANNNFDGELPNTLTQLSDLATLAVDNNQFAGAMPEGIDEMKSLKELYVRNNNFANLDNIKEMVENQLVVTDVTIITSKAEGIQFENKNSGISNVGFQDH